MGIARIDWDEKFDSKQNRGTDGYGLIASFDVIGTKPKVVHLRFSLQLEDYQDVSGEQLIKLAHRIGSVIRGDLDG